MELRSASDTLNQLQDKLQEYIANGVGLGWLIDRQQQTVSIYRPQQPPLVLPQPTSVSGDPELPSFVLDLGPIW